MFVYQVPSDLNIYLLKIKSMFENAYAVQFVV